ncbi:MAG: TonB-dependent receptor [Psychroflexus sp.]
MKNLLLGVFLMIGIGVFAQGTVSGTVIDMEMSSPLPGANVQVVGTSNGTTTNFDGEFSLEVSTSTGKIRISYLGFKTQEIDFEIESGQSLDLGEINLQASADALDEIVVIGKGVVDVAIGRDTPVAVSTVTSKDIQKRSGNEEFPTLLRSVPSVYANTQGGGYGDSEIRVRGFDQSNTAVLLNGQPINGMEDGNMYWSNWQGVKDIASAVQVQRGLGASKLAISSVGGTINIVTETYNNTERSYVQQDVANGNYTKSTAYHTTGANENGWSSTYMLSYWQGEGNYYDGTEGEGLTYFFSVGYKPSDEHAFNLLLTGAPQTHDQAYQGNIGNALDYGRRYNSNWGTRNGEYYNERTNFYHKPVVNLNWDWNISDDTDLSTVAYASIGRGGGTGPLGGFSSKNNANGQINFDAIIENNQNLPTTSYGGSDLRIGNDPSLNGDDTGYITRASMNNHFWTGMVSNLNHRVNDELEFNVGFDYRYYHGDHYRQVVDRLGLDGWYEGGNGSIPNGQPVLQNYDVNLFSPTFNNARSDQQIGYSNSEDIAYIGGFGQVEYKTDKFSTFLQAALSNQKHTRYDYFAYTLPSEQESESVENVGYNVKTGLNYNIDDKHNVFTNIGYYSRQPFHDNVYRTFTNEINPLADNEDITGLELGYGFTSENFSANFNAYWTKWANRTDTSSLFRDLDGDDVDEEYIANFTQIEQTHYGVELDFLYKPIYGLNITGMASVGNWEYSDNPNQDVFDANTLEIIPEISGTESYVDGEKIGNAPQTTFNLGASYNVTDNLSVDADWFYYGNLYANLDPLEFTDSEADNEILELPTYDLVRIGASYNLDLGDNKSLDFRGSIDNVFNEVYLTSLETNRQVEAGDRTFKGIAETNRGFFGFNRQWSLSVRFNF